MPTTPMALYYPWMHFQSDSWLKTALLTWEKLVRVRPRDIEDRDNNLVRRVREETDLLVEVVPSERDLQVVSDAFTGVIDSYRTYIAEIFDTRTTRFQPIDPRAEKGYEAPASNAGYYPGTPLTWVYSGPGGSRMDRSLQDRLIELGVAKRAPRRGPWVGMRPRLASIYMATLADAVASHNNLVPTTDDPRMHSAVGAIEQLTGLLFDAGYDPVREDPAGAYVHLAVAAVLEPRNPGTISIDKLIDFRKRHEAELRAFWGHVSGLADELARVAAVDNPELAQLHLQDIYESQTKAMLRDLQRGLLSTGVDTVAGSMALKVNVSAASGTALGAAALAGGHVALGTASVALTVVPYFVTRARQVKAQQTASPVAYLLAANRSLSGKNLLQLLQRKSAG
jgi:hypothetical protein